MDPNSEVGKWQGAKRQYRELDLIVPNAQKGAATLQRRIASARYPVGTDRFKAADIARKAHATAKKEAHQAGTRLLETPPVEEEKLIGSPHVRPGQQQGLTVQNLQSLAQRQIAQQQREGRHPKALRHANALLLQGINDLPHDLKQLSRPQHIKPQQVRPKAQVSVQEDRQRHRHQGNGLHRKQSESGIEAYAITPVKESHNGYPPSSLMNASFPGYGQATSTNSNVQRKKQMRATRACEQCQARKQICDDGNPCSFCRENSFACRYRDTPAAKNDRYMNKSSQPSLERNLWVTDNQLPRLPDSEISIVPGTQRLQQQKNVLSSNLYPATNVFNRENFTPEKGRPKALQRKRRLSLSDRKSPVQERDIHHTVSRDRTNAKQDEEQLIVTALRGPTFVMDFASVPLAGIINQHVHHQQQTTYSDMVAEAHAKYPRPPRPSYSEEQKFFIMYYRVIKELSWPEIEDKFATFFNLRTKDGLTSVYYRIRKNWGMEEVLTMGDRGKVESKAAHLSREFLTNLGYFD